MEHNQLSPQDEEAKRNALIAYILMLIGCFTGLFFIAGGIWALVSKDNARQSRFADHFENAITVFIWGIVLGVIFGLLTLIIIGVPLLFALAIWIIYRVVKGLVSLTSDRPYRAYQ